MVVKSTFRAKGDWPAFATYWYEGKDKDGKPFLPHPPVELKTDNGKLPTNGNLVVGAAGKMLVSGAYWNEPILLPGSKHRGFKRPQQLLERSPGHHA